MNKKLKNILFSLGTILVSIAPIATTIACGRNKTNKENQEEEYNFDSQLLDKFPKEVLLNFNNEQATHLIKEKIKTSIQKNANDLNNNEKEAFYHFIETYFENGKLNLEKHIFTINHNGEEYKIKFQNGQTFEVKIKLENSDSKSKIIEKVIQSLENLKAQYAKPIIYALENHSKEIKLDKSKQSLTFYDEDSSFVIYYSDNKNSKPVILTGLKNWEKVDSSNIGIGMGGMIFEDSNGNIYSMGNGTSLQVKYNNSNEFTEIEDSNIYDGHDGVIFEDSLGNIYAMGVGTGLQVKPVGQEKFIDAPGTNINDGEFGSIFEDSQGNIYAMGYETGLQVKLKNEKEFKNAPGTNIIYGGHGTIFEDSQGNIYAMGSLSGLQVKPKGEETFINAPGSNIMSGSYGVIFEDSQGNIYAMGQQSGLQVKFSSSSNN